MSFWGLEWYYESCKYNFKPNELKSTRRRQANDINTFRPQALISITNEYFPIKAETSSDRILTIL